MPNLQTKRVQAQPETQTENDSGNAVKDPEDVAKKMQLIHIVFGNLKAFLNGTYHGVSSKHLQAYLNEYVFRFNRRRLIFEAFNTLLGIGTSKEGPTYYQLYHTGKARGWIHPNPREV